MDHAAHLTWLAAGLALTLSTFPATTPPIEAQDVERIYELPQRHPPTTPDGGGTIRGRVTFAASGLPVSGTDVLAKFEGLPGAARGTTGADGTYEIPLFSGGTWYVYLRDIDNDAIGQLYSATQCLDPGRVCDIESGDPVVVPNGGAVENIDFAVEVGGKIAGEFEEVTTGFSAGVFQDINLFDGSGQLVATMFTYMRSSVSEVNYRTYPVPAGSYFVVATETGFRDQLYPLMDCDDLACDPTDGDPVIVTAQSVTTDIDFAAAVDASQGGAFAGTVASAVEDVLFSPFVRAWDPLTEDFLGDALTRDGYVIAGLPLADVRATSFEPGYARQLYDQKQCNGTGFPACDVAEGTPIQVTAGQITPGVDFLLVEPDIFEDGFETGNTTAWSSTSQ